MTTATPGLHHSRQQVIDLLSQHKQEWCSRYGIQEMVLFGSLARNEGDPASDVDLCVTLEPPDPFSLVYFRQAVQDLLGVRVDVVTRWPGMNPVLGREIERDAIPI